MRVPLRRTVGCSIHDIVPSLEHLVLVPEDCIALSDLTQEEIDAIAGPVRVNRVGFTLSALRLLITHSDRIADIAVGPNRARPGHSASSH